MENRNIFNEQANMFTCPRLGEFWLISFLRISDFYTERLVNLSECQQPRNNGAWRS